MSFTMKRSATKHLFVLALLCSNVMFAASMEERSAQLRKILCITSAFNQVAGNASVFSNANSVRAGKYELQIQEGSMPTSTGIATANVVLNGAPVAFICIRETPSYDAAEKALLGLLVMNSMSIEMIARRLAVPNIGIGNLCIAEKHFDQTIRQYSSIPECLHFVRGGTAVSVSPATTNQDIIAIAKAVDALLLASAGSSTVTTIKPTPVGNIKSPIPATATRQEGIHERQNGNSSALPLSASSDNPASPSRWHLWLIAGIAALILLLLGITLRRRR